MKLTDEQKQAMIKTSWVFQENEMLRRRIDELTDEIDRLKPKRCSRCGALLCKAGTCYQCGGI